MRDTWLVFIILHLMVYPASNGYNSYMDRDEGPIGGLAKPLAPTPQLFWVTVWIDLGAVLLSLLVSLWFCFGILIYILISKAYSYRGIRLKKYPIASHLAVILFQGIWVFHLCWHGCSVEKTLPGPALPALGAGLLIGGFYPLTQIYQHEADRADGVRTMSMLLGYRGSFIYCGIVYSLALAIIGVYFYRSGQLNDFFLLLAIMLPVVIFFLYWAVAVWKDTNAANFNNTMRMNVIASICTSLAFLIMIIKP